MARIKIADAPRRPRSVLCSAPASRKRSCGEAKPPPTHATIDDIEFPLSKVFRSFFPFVAERHAIFTRRLAGEPRPWTQDPIFQEYPFTNVFRVLDRNSQYVLRNVIPVGRQDLEETFFRVLLFRTFNKIETYELLKKKIRPLTWASFSIAKYEKVLSESRATLYGACYIIPAPNLGYDKNYSNHLRMIETMMEVDQLPVELRKLKHLKDAHGRIQMYQSMGEFMAMQLLLDLNMMPHYNWSEDEWVALGPGSIACLKKMFGPGIAPHALSAVRYIRDSQHSWFIHSGIGPAEIPRLHKSRPASLTMVDIEHALCECEKYSRAKFPEIKGKRTQVAKHVFVPKPEPITGDVPVNWQKPRPVVEWKCPPPVDGTDDTYEVSHIVKQKKSLYLIRWLGYGPEEDSWVPAKDLGEGASLLIERWEKTKARINTGLKLRSKTATATGKSRKTL